MQEFGDTPQPYVYAYGAMHVALNAIARAGVKVRAAVRDAILATGNNDGVLGP